MKTQNVRSIYNGKARREIEAVLETIAKEQLNIETLTVRNSDRLDFHDVGVASLRDALEAAFEAGRTAARRDEARRANAVARGRTR